MKEGKEKDMKKGKSRERERKVESKRSKRKKHQWVKKVRAERWRGREDREAGAFF